MKDYLDVTEIANMTVGITGSTVMFTGRVEMGSNLMAISSQLAAFMHVDSVHAGL